MKLYLNEKEHSIKFLHLMDVMLKGAMKSEELGILEPSSISTTIKYADPVADFLRFYRDDADLKRDEETGEGYTDAWLYWMTNALYAAKGSLQIIELLSEGLDLEITNCEYNPPELSITIESVRAHDVALFHTKFFTLMYYLLYYTNMELGIKEILLELNSTLTQMSYAAVKGFTHLTSEVQNGI